jgi:hypothetical protein
VLERVKAVGRARRVVATDVSVERRDDFSVNQHKNDQGVSGHKKKKAKKFHFSVRSMSLSIEAFSSSKLRLVAPDR